MQNNLTPAWTLILVPPTTTASPRRFGVKKRTVHLTTLFLAAAVVIPWLWTLAASDTAGQMADRLAAQQRLSVALHDTVESLRATALAALSGKLPPIGM